MSYYNHLKGSDIGYDHNNNNFRVQSTQKIFRDSFSTLNPSKWQTVSIGDGHTVTASNGTLNINTGTKANTETVLLSRDIFTIPLRAMFGMMMSQRIIGNEFYFELVSVDPMTGEPDNLSSSSWFFNSNVNTRGYYMVSSEGITPFMSGALTTIASSGYSIKEIELFSDEAWFHERAVDSTNGRSASYIKNQLIPDPNSFYKVRIRAKNTNEAPITVPTVLSIQHVTVVDFAELTTEVTAGRGSTTAGQGMPVLLANTANMNVVNTPSVNANLVQNSTYYTDSVTKLNPSQIFTGTIRDLGTSSTATLLYSKIRVMVQHTAGLNIGHLVVEQSDSATMATVRETHRVPIPSDASYRTFEFPVESRYVRVKFINNATIQTSFYIGTVLMRSDGVTDMVKHIPFVFNPPSIAQATAFTSDALNLGPNHNFNKIKAIVATDKNGTLSIQQSKDGTVWRDTKKVDITTSVLGVYPLLDDIYAPYVRFVFTNTATATNTSLELIASVVNG